MPRLLIQQAGQEPRVFELPHDRPVRLGRGETNDLVLRDSSVSRKHALLRPAPDGTWEVSDLGSSNGVLVNGVFVKVAKLKSNDEISLGAYTLRFEALDTQDLVAQATARLPARLTQILNLPEVEATPLAPGPARPQVREQREPATRTTGPPPGVAERRADWERRLQVTEHENRLLVLLYRVSQALGELATVDEVVGRILELVLEIEGVERGYAMLLDETMNFLPAVVRYRHPQESSGGPEMILSQSLIRRVMDGGLPILVQDARADARFASSQSLALSGMQSAMCAPLRTQDRLFGLLYVDNLSKSGMFSEEDLNVFAVIAAQAGRAIDHVRAREEVAQQVIELNALERFHSPGVARKILSEAASLRLGGENQEVTVLFADIRGFTTMAEEMRPEEAVELLNEFFNTMTELIFQHEGTLDKYLGDGLMCLWGAPFPGRQASFQAVRTAIEMHIHLLELNRESHRPPLRMGIGINTGPAVVGYIGASRRMDYTAVGDTVNVASRLTAQAEPDQILISAATHAEIAGQLPIRKLQAVKVKGRAEPIEVFEVLWKEFLPVNPTA